MQGLVMSCKPERGSSPETELCQNLDLPASRTVVRREYFAVSAPGPWSPAAAAAAKSLQSCPTLCDPMDCSLPGSSGHGIFQARVLESGAIAFSAWSPELIVLHCHREY